MSIKKRAVPTRLGWDDDSIQIVIDSISIGAQSFFQNQNNGTPLGTGAQDKLPYLDDGFLRRIRVRQNENWRFAVRNLSPNDTYRVSVAFEQYAVYGDQAWGRCSRSSLAVTERRSSTSTGGDQRVR